MELSPDASKFKLVAVSVPPNALETRETAKEDRQRENRNA